MSLCNVKANCKTRKPTPILSAMRRRLNRQTKLVEVLKSKLGELQLQLHKHKNYLKHTICELDDANAEANLRSSIEQPSPCLPCQSERPMPGFHFNLTTIVAAIELGKRVGFRAAAAAMKIFFDVFGIDLKVPSHDAIEQWTLRLGVACLEGTFEKGERVLWMVDHSSQIGKERLLIIVGVALKDLPPPGTRMTFDNLKVLAIVPGQSWKKEDVEREYLKLAEQIGSPVYLLCDGATELRDAAQKLEKNGEKTIVLGDLKHHAANILEKEISRGERFSAFLSEVGLTRNRIQQTVLAQFAPPTLRSKSRFMNLGSLFNWTTMVLYHLNTPGSQSRLAISDGPMEQKLGWLREYADDLAGWNACQTVIDISLLVVNKHGLDAQTPGLLEQALSEANSNWRNEDCSATRIGVQLSDWINQSFRKLHADERAWLSTEILESLFGKFKQLERQHSKGGFTRLIAAIPTLCLRVTRDMVRASFQRVNSKTLKKWIQDSLGKTLTARRNAAYRESRSKTCDHTISPA